MILKFVCKTQVPPHYLTRASFYTETGEVDVCMPDEIRVKNSVDACEIEWDLPYETRAKLGANVVLKYLGGYDIDVKSCSIDDVTEIPVWRNGHLCWENNRIIWVDKYEEGATALLIKFDEKNAFSSFSTTFCTVNKFYDAKDFSRLDMNKKIVSMYDEYGDRFGAFIVFDRYEYYLTVQPFSFAFTYYTWDISLRGVDIPGTNPF